MNAHNLAAKINDLGLEDGILSISVCRTMEPRVHLTEEKFREVATGHVTKNEFRTNLIESRFEINGVTFFALQNIDIAKMQAALQLVMAA